VRGILADHNVTRHFRLLLRLLEDESRREFWSFLNCVTPSLEEIGLAINSPDLIVWQECQKRELVLLTGNRNAKGPDSLEMTIRKHNSPQCLPVMTIGNPDRFLVDRTYADRVTDRFLDFVMEIDNLRGTGRIYLP
jgi:hypothetical protein